MISISKPVVRSIPARSVPGTAFGWFLGVFAALGTVVRNRRHMKDLRDLDDLLLADIGLTREDVERASRAPLFSDPTLLLAGKTEAEPARPRGRRGDLRLVSPGRHLE